MSDKSVSSPSASAPLPLALAWGFGAGFAAGLAAGLAGVFAAVVATLAGAVAVFLGSALAAVAALGLLDGVTGTEELTFGMDFLGTALDTTRGVTLALTKGGFLSGVAFFALPGTVGLDAFSGLLFAFAGVLLFIFLVIVTLIFAVDLAATAFLAGALVNFTATAFFGFALVLLLAPAFALVSGAFALLAMATFLAGAATALVLTATFTSALAATFTGLANTFLAGTGLVLAAGAFFIGTAFFATGFLTTGLVALVFFGVGMVQPSMMKRIGWRHQQSNALVDQRRQLSKMTGTWGKLCGRTFGLQPLRSGGLGDQCHWVAGAGGTAVALAEKTDYTIFNNSNSSVSDFFLNSRLR